MSEKKTDGAIRLYEAMEGVDPELLARSERAGKKNSVVPFRRFTRVAAACLAMFVVGGACWVTLRNGGQQETTADSVMNAKVGKPENAVDEQAYNDEAYHAKGADNIAQAEAIGDIENFDAAEEAEWNDTKKEHDLDGATEEDLAGGKTEACVRSEQLQVSGEVALADKEMLLTYGKHGIQSLNAEKESYFNDKWMEISFGAETPVRIPNHSMALAIYSYLSQLELEPVSDQSLQDFVTVRIYDARNSMTDSYHLSGRYVQLMGLPDTYEILNQDYDFEEFRTELEELVREE